MHRLTVRRYLERNPLRARLVERAEDQVDPQKLLGGPRKWGLAPRSSEVPVPISGDLDFMKPSR